MFLAAAVGVMLAQAALFSELLRQNGASTSRLTFGVVAAAFAALVMTALAFPAVLRRRSTPAPLDPAAESLRLAVSSAGKVGWDWDVVTGTDTWFGDLKTMFGIDAPQFSGRVEDFRTLVHPDDREILWRAVAAARSGEKAYHAKFRVVWADGTTRWVEATGRFYHDAKGVPVRMLGIASDITDSRQIEDQLRESEERFRVAADSAPVLLWMAADDGACEYVNRAWLTFTGRSFDAEMGSGWTESLHPDDREYCLATYHQALDRREPFTLEYRLRRHDGVYRWVMDAGVPRFIKGAFIGYIGSAVDVTPHRLAEESLSALTHKLFDAYERERLRIAKELHDDFGQRVALVTFELDRLQQVLPIGSEDARVRARELADRAVDLERDLRTMSDELHSSKPELLGLASASAALCREMSMRHDAVIRFEQSAVPADLATDIAIALFRVLQEALVNAVTHADAGQLTVSLRGLGDCVELEIVDVGVGFDLDAAMKGDGVGLIGMQERMARVKGRFEIESRAGGGTKVRATAPLDPAKNGDVVQP